MKIEVREYRTEDATAASEIWNQVVDDGVAFPQEEWERMDALLEDKGMLKPRQVKRFLYAYACEVEPDKQGRILLSPSLRAHYNKYYNGKPCKKQAFLSVWCYFHSCETAFTTRCRAFLF